MSWLNWFRRKESDVARVIYLLSGGSAVWQPQNYETFAKEGYGANVTVYACINEIARSVGGLCWTLSRKGTGEQSRTQQPIENHKLLDLLMRPNPCQGKGAFIEQLVGYWLITGNSYVNMIAANENRPPMELWNLRPDRIVILPASVGGEVAFYRYTAGGQQKDLEAFRVLHSKLFNPLDDWYGMSPLQVAARLVDTDIEAIKWNKALLQNAARPSGALSTEQPLTDPQFERLKVQMLDYQGTANAGRPLLLEGGLKWQAMSMNPSELDFVNSRKMSKRELCQVYQVPPELIGDSESKTYSNYQEARKAFYQETVLPMALHLRDDLNNVLVPRFGDGLYLDIDKDEIDALAEERSALWTRAQQADWLTINEKRVLTGYDEIEGGDVVLVNASQLPLGTESATPDPTLPAEEPPTA